MEFTEQELMDVLLHIYTSCNNDTSAVCRITREYLDSLPVDEKWKIINGVAILVEKGFLERVVPANQDTPFMGRLSKLGSRAVKTASLKRTDWLGGPGIPYL